MVYLRKLQAAVMALFTRHVAYSRGGANIRGDIRVATPNAE